MNDTINLSNFLKDLNIKHSDTLKSYSEDTMLLSQQPEDVAGITYYSTEHIVYNNVESIKKNSSGQYYYEFRSGRFCDIMDNIKYESSTGLDAKLVFIIGGIEYQQKEFNEFVMISAPYHDFIIQVVFTKKPVLNDEFKINSRHMLLNSIPRNVLSKSPVITMYNKYFDGMCGKI